jgi:gliding motility-associated-like protein
VAPKPQASFNNNTACAGQPTLFTNTSTGDTYLWNFGDGTPTSTDTSTTHTYVTGGLFPVVLVAYEGNCTDTATNNVTVYSNPVSSATITPTLAVANEDSILFNADTTGITNWNWDLGNGDSAHLAQFNYTYQDTGVYSVSLVTVNANGCTDTLVLPDSVHIVAPARIFVPNAFSPNLDGKNDQLWVMGSGVKFFHFWIYDRWGTLVFETRDMTQGWDGTYNGKPAEPGVYVYQLKVDFENTMQKLYKGSITLLR